MRGCCAAQIGGLAGGCEGESALGGGGRGYRNRKARKSRKEKSGSSAVPLICVICVNLFLIHYLCVSARSLALRQALAWHCLQHIPLPLHARPDRGTNRRRPGDRGNDPTLRGSGIFEPHSLGRCRAALRKIGLVLFRRVVALDGRIVIGTPGHTRQQGKNNQGGAERLHAFDGSGRERLRQRQTGHEVSSRFATSRLLRSHRTHT